MARPKPPSPFPTLLQRFLSSTSDNIVQSVRAPLLLIATHSGCFWRSLKQRSRNPQLP
jgi:hypothetical protein